MPHASGLARLGLLIALALCGGTLLAGQSEAFALAEAGATASGRCIAADQYTTSGPQTALALASIGGTPSDPDTCNPSDPVFGVAIFAGSVSAANLRRGELSAWAEAGGAGDPFSYPSGFMILSYGESFARISDGITIVRASGAPFSTSVRVTLHVEGTLSGYSVVNATLRVGSQQVSNCAGTYTTSCHILSPSGPFSFDLVFNVPVSSSAPTLQLVSTLTASALNTGVADASNTATLSIELPPGFSFTSESGVLLVPEPGLLALAAAGLAMLASFRRS